MYVQDVLATEYITYMYAYFQDFFVNCSASTEAAGLHTREFFVCEKKHMTDQQEMVC